MIYLDNAATTIPSQEVVEAVQKLYQTPLANPSSVHPLGLKAKQVLNQARKFFADHFQIPQEGVLFCSSGTESINLALKGTMLGNTDRAEGHLITTTLEHAAVLNSATNLEEHGCKVTRLTPDHRTGQISAEELVSHITAETKLVSIQWINSETGIIQDIPSLAKAIKEKNPNCYFHVDAVQAFGKIPTPLQGIDLLSISAHKLRGLPGTGALILGGNIPLQPIIHGGGQEFGLRSGTENIYGIHGFQVAAQKALENQSKNFQTVQEYGSQFQTLLQAKVKGMDCYLSQNSKLQKSPYILNLHFEGVLGEVLLNHLAAQKIAVSTGSACNARSKKLSGVLQSLGFSDQRIKESIRVSLHPDFLEIAVEEVVEIFADCIEEIREMNL